MNKPPRDDVVILYAIVMVLAVSLLCWVVMDWIAWK